MAAPINAKINDLSNLHTGFNWHNIKVSKNAKKIINMIKYFCLLTNKPASNEPIPATLRIFPIIAPKKKIP